MTETGTATTRLRRVWRAMAALMLALALLAPSGVAIAAPSPTGATITSDKADYAPGEKVTLIGAGWAAGESVSIVVNDTIGQTWQHLATVKAKKTGAFTDVSASILIVRAPDAEAALALARDDVYWRNGVWVDLRCRPFGLVVRPGGGPDDYAAFLHELGHALHFAHTDPRLPVEDRRLGDASVTETFAFLMDGLLRERGWLRRFVGLAQPADLLRFNAFHKLWFLRRYASKLEYELTLHADGPTARCADLYRDLLAGATLVDWPRELSLADLDPFFYAARYLRAWIFEAQLRELLRERFDEEWYRNDRTGPFLLALWQRGQRHPIEQLAVELGLGPLSLDPLLAQLTSALN